LEEEARSAVSHSAITVVSAFPAGKGVTIGLDIPCEVTAQIRDQDNGGSRIQLAESLPDPHALVVTSARKAMACLGVRLQKRKSLSLKVKSSIPAAVGLKSSSAVSVAVTKVVFDLFHPASPTSSRTQKILRTSCEASIECGASLTGAFDDAAAGLLGGLVYSDNMKFKLLGHEPFSDELGSMVKILVPIENKKLTSSLNLAAYREHRDESLEAYHFARQGVIVQAMLLNSIIHSVIHHYSMQPVVSSIAEGASASGISGKGPSISAICRSKKVADRVEGRWLEENPDCKVISANITKPVDVIDKS
jgi:shikimate kinase